MPHIVIDPRKEEYVGLFSDELEKRQKVAMDAFHNVSYKCKNLWDVDAAIVEIGNACQLYISGLDYLGFYIVGQQIAKKQEELQRVRTQNYHDNRIHLKLENNTMPGISANTVHISVEFKTIEGDEYVYINTYTFVFETWLDKEKMKEEVENFKTANPGNLSRVKTPYAPGEPRN